jgi:hypothetical protein
MSMPLVMQVAAKVQEALQLHADGINFDLEIPMEVSGGGGGFGTGAWLQEYWLLASRGGLVAPCSESGYKAMLGRESGSVLGLQVLDMRFRSAAEA